MILQVNGEELKTDAKTIEMLIKELGIENQVMAAAVNLNVVKQENWKTYELKENDSVEFLRFVGGGGGNDILPNPNVIFPVPNTDTVTYIKPTIKNKNIIVGDFTYFSDVDFEKHVTHFYEFYDDKLIIGKFCQIASGVEFIMNGANHQMNSVSTFPFYIFEKWNESAPSLDKLPLKGDTVIGNDVWIGQNSTILPGVKIGDGAIIGAKSVVGSDIEPYTIAVGNPARVIKKRFDEELIELMLKLKWWDLPIKEIMKLIPLLHDNDIENVKKRLKEIVNYK